MTNNLISTTDLYMAASNAVSLGGYYVLKSAYESEDENQIKTTMAIAIPVLMVGQVMNSIANYKMLPQNASILRKVISFPIPTSMTINGVGLGPLNKIKQVVSFCNVAQNTVPKLKNCVLNFTTTPIRALACGAVHTLNLGAEIFSLGCTFDLFGNNHDSNSAPESEPKQESSGSSTKPQTESTPRQETSGSSTDPIIARLTNEQLNPTRFKDAKEIFQLPNQKVEPETCRNHRFSYIADVCNTVCSSVRKSWRQISLQVHPDKNTSPQATVASQRLNVAKETLDKAYAC